MGGLDSRSAAFAGLAPGAGLATSPAFAHTLPVAVPAQEDVVDGGIATASPAVPRYTCGYDELQTHLQRRFCGGGSVGAGFDRGGL